MNKINFLDELNIYVSGGCGGNGSKSFSKNKNGKFKPDGGNGGNGGNVYIIAKEKIFSFNELKIKNKYIAQNGDSGSKNKKNGKNGKSTYINVPLGTIIYDNQRKIFLKELLKKNEKFLAAKGGKGGTGSFFLKNNISNLYNGKKGDLNFLHLELNLIANIGLFGFPNSGKSLFLNNLTKSKSKVANYQFTTTTPVLGEFKYEINKNIIISDVPGLIENASEGKGLGIKFLKHLMKTELLIHLYDVIEENKLINNILKINKELKKFNLNLYYKEKWLIINKIDLIKHLFLDIKIKKILFKLNYKNFFFISNLKKNNLKKLSFNIKEYFKGK